MAEGTDQPVTRHPDYDSERTSNRRPRRRGIYYSTRSTRNW